MDDKMLNKSLALAAGFELAAFMHETELFTHLGLPKNSFYDCPEFTQSLDACFKWLVPKLKELDPNTRIEFQSNQVSIFRSNPADDDFPTKFWASAWADTPALALCRAVEKILIA